jgi:hypothetical protein
MNAAKRGSGVESGNPETDRGLPAQRPSPDREGLCVCVCVKARR